MLILYRNIMITISISSQPDSSLSICRHQQLPPASTSYIFPSSMTLQLKRPHWLNWLGLDHLAPIFTVCLHELNHQHGISVPIISTTAAQTSLLQLPISHSSDTLPRPRYPPSIKHLHLWEASHCRSCPTHESVLSHVHEELLAAGGTAYLVGYDLFLLLILVEKFLGFGLLDCVGGLN